MSTPSSEQAMHETSSLRTTQVMLRTCMSALLSYRDILPQKAFEVRTITTTEDEDSYTLHALRHGLSQRGDTILNWMDGLNYLTEQHALTAFQCCIHPGKKTRGRALETYTFTIRYNGAKYLSNKIIEETQELRDEDMKRVLLKVERLCGKMLELPDERYFSMNVFLEPTATDVDLNGFSAARRETLVFPADKGWSRRKETIDLPGTAFYRPTLTISYMTSLGKSRDLTKLNDYSDTISMTDDINMTPVSTEDEEIDSVTQPSKTPRRNASETEDTQEIVAAGIQAALNAMNRREKFTQGDTQAASFPQHSMFPPRNKLRLVFRNLEYLRSGKGEAIERARLLAKKIGGKTSANNTILCSCAYSREEGDMFKCSICETWQHAHCSGFTGYNDPRRPDDHICYICLIDSRQGTLQATLMKFAMERRAMFNILQKGTKSKTDLAEDLKLSLPIGKAIFDGLWSKNFMVNASGSHKAGFKTTGKPSFVPAVAGEGYGKILNHYFNPTTFIEEYFESPTVSPSELADQLVIEPTIDMPLAAASLQERRKRKPEPSQVTPATNFNGQALLIHSGRQRRSVRDDAEDVDETDLHVNKQVKITQEDVNNYISLTSERMIDCGL